MDASSARAQRVAALYAGMTGLSSIPENSGASLRWADADICPYTVRGSIVWLNCSFMFARRIHVEYEDNGRRLPCPLKWLDSFAMRNFTNASVFDNTLPVADGVMEIGTSVAIAELKDAMEDWFRRKSYLPKESVLILEPCGS
jgi:hypothetical protein